MSSMNWYMQNSAPAHRALPVHNRLQELFGNCVVGMGHQIDWPARSPDLSPLDFYLWGTVKQRVYRQGSPASLQQLQNRITDTFNEIRRTREVRRAGRHMETRAQRCVNLQGGHVDGRAGLQWVLSYNMICSTKPNGTFQSQQSPNSPFRATKKQKRKVRHCHMPSLMKYMIQIMYGSLTEMFLCHPIDISISLEPLDQSSPFFHHCKGKSMTYLEMDIICSRFILFLKYSSHPMIAIFFFFLTHPEQYWIC